MVADAVALERLGAAGLNVLSEESGLLDRGAALTAVVDPIDGSTNASRGLHPWASSIAILDDAGPLVGAVALSHRRGVLTAVRGQGAWWEGGRLVTSGARSARGRIVAANGTPTAWLGWGQLRAYGSAAAELCFVAEGSLDGLVDFSHGLAIWDIVAGVLLVREAGGTVLGRGGEPARTDVDAPRQRIVAAASAELAAELAAGLAEAPPRDEGAWRSR